MIGKRIKSLRIEKKLTQEELALAVNSTKQNISKYENGIITNIPMTKITEIAKFFGVTPAYLVGWTNNRNETLLKTSEIMQLPEIENVSHQKIPMLGEISCGEPKYTAEDRESYVVSGTKIPADFCLTCRGDSMTEARIYDGDIVFCRYQSFVENGEIAAVIIGDEATLKRVYYYPAKQTLILQPANPKYDAFIYTGEELTQIKIIGKAVAFQGDVK